MLTLATNMNNARYLNKTEFYTDKIKTLNQIIEAHPEQAPPPLLKESREKNRIKIKRSLNYFVKDK